MLTNFSKTLQFEEAQKSCVWFLTSYIATDRHNKANRCIFAAFALSVCLKWHNGRCWFVYLRLTVIRSVSGNVLGQPVCTISCRS